MKACCCPLRIGALVGLGCALLYNIALAAFLWSGFPGFTTEAAEQRVERPSVSSDLGPNCEEILAGRPFY